MAIEGSLDDFRLSDILQMVAQQQKTGILTIQGEATIVAVSFLSGRVVAADSLEETVEQRLGEVLVRRGLVSRDDFNRVAERERRGEGRLVDLLVATGYLERAQVLDSLRQQTEGLLHGLLDWRRGEFKFYGNDEVSYEEGFQPISVENLLLSSLGGDDETALPAAVPTPSFGLPSFTDEDDEAEPSPAAAPPPSLGSLRILRPQTASVPDLAALERSGVFVPPAEAAPRGEDAAPARPRLAVVTATAGGLLVPLLAAVLAVALVAALTFAASGFLLPFPWQQGERQAYEEVARQASYQAIDRAAKTFFLLEGRFPDRLDRLSELSMLDADDLRDPTGAPLVYTPGEDGYRLHPQIAGSEAGGGLTRSEAITGNFLLDPEFLSAGPSGGQAPLVLLD